MKLQRLICIATALILILSFTSCNDPSDRETTGDFKASVQMIVENMGLSETEAVCVLETLAPLGLDERIEYIYTGESDGEKFYKIWFGLNLLNVYMDGTDVIKVYKYGKMIYPHIEDEGEDGKNDNEDNNNNPNIPNDLDISIVSLTSPIKAGQSATVEILGEPDTEYAISVIYSSGPSSAKGLEPKLSDKSGKVSWSWRVSSLVKPGEYSIVIESNGASYKTTFVVE